MPDIHQVDLNVIDNGIYALLCFSWGGIEFPMSLDIGYARIDILLSNVRLGSAMMFNVLLNDEKYRNFTLPLNLMLEPQDPLIAKTLSDLINPLFSETPLPQTIIGLTNLQFGASESTFFDLFKYITIPVLDTDIPKENNLINDGTSPAIPSMSNIFGFEEASIETIASDLKANILFNLTNIPVILPFKWTLMIPYIAIDVMLNTYLVGKLSLVNLHYDGEQNQAFNLDVRLSNCSKDENMHDLVNAAWQGLSGNADIITVKASLTNLMIGSNPDKLIGLFKLVKIDYMITESFGFTELLSLKSNTLINTLVDIDAGRDSRSTFNTKKPVSFSLTTTVDGFQLIGEISCLVPQRRNRPATAASPG